VLAPYGLPKRNLSVGQCPVYLKQNNNDDNNNNNNNNNSLGFWQWYSVPLKFWNLTIFIHLKIRD
jgi:hypothetical protein